ncbi:Metal tolerance protein C4 [Nymphaea thermarum]|nr:Metal tolerance protein C4 [Nymphaea thermarum]
MKYCLLMDFNFSQQAVTTALWCNFLVFSLKFGVWLATSSHVMLAEVIHSVADFANQVLLAYGLNSSRRAPDALHPYGYSKERFVWSLISAVGIFCLGSGATIIHGIQNLWISQPPANVYYAALVIGGSFLIEGASLVVAIKAVRKGAAAEGLKIWDYIWRGHDPTSVAVMTEDSAAVTGLLIAAASLVAVNKTGNAIYDPIGSIVVGNLLGMVCTCLFLNSISKFQCQLLLTKSGPEMGPSSNDGAVGFLTNTPLCIRAQGYGFSWNPKSSLTPPADAARCLSPPPMPPAIACPPTQPDATRHRQDRRRRPDRRRLDCRRQDRRRLIAVVAWPVPADTTCPCPVLFLVFSDCWTSFVVVMAEEMTPKTDVNFDTGSNTKSENVPVQVTSIQLNKDNLSWSAALEIGITSRGRLPYITGEKPAPSKTDPGWATWALEDSQP